MDNQTENSLLHFEHDDPALPDLRFDSMQDALTWVKNMGYNLGEWSGAEDEDWEPTGMIEEKLDVWDSFDFVGQLLRLRELCPKCCRPDGVEHHGHRDEDGALLCTYTICCRCGHNWNII